MHKDNRILELKGIGCLWLIGCLTQIEGFYFEYNRDSLKICDQEIVLKKLSCFFVIFMHTGNSKKDLLVKMICV